MRARSSSFPGCSRWEDWQEPRGGRSQPGRQARLALSLFLLGSLSRSLALPSPLPRARLSSAALLSSLLFFSPLPCPVSLPLSLSLRLSSAGPRMTITSQARRAPTLCLCKKVRAEQRFRRTHGGTRWPLPATPEHKGHEAAGCAPANAPLAPRQRQITELADFWLAPESGPRERWPPTDP